MRLSTRGIEQSPVKAPAFNISLGSIGVLALGTVLTVWKNGFEFLFGSDVSNGVRAAVLIATIAAFAVVVAVDMLARALAVRSDQRHVVTMAKGWTAGIVRDGAADIDYLVAAARIGSDGSEFLLVKDGAAPSWYSAQKVVLKAPTGS